MSKYPLRLGTIGSYLDERYRITVHCNEMDGRHTSKLDLEALATRLGRDYDIIGADNPIRKALRCAKCGVRGNVQFNISPPSNAGAGPSLRPEEHEALKGKP